MEIDLRIVLQKALNEKNPAFAGFFEWFILSYSVPSSTMKIRSEFGFIGPRPFSP